LLLRLLLDVQDDGRSKCVPDPCAPEALVADAVLSR